MVTPCDMCVYLGISRIFIYLLESVAELFNIDTLNRFKDLYHVAAEKESRLLCNPYIYPALVMLLMFGGCSLIISLHKVS